MNSFSDFVLNSTWGEKKQTKQKVSIQLVVAEKVPKNLRYWVLMINYLCLCMAHTGFFSLLVRQMQFMFAIQMLKFKCILGEYL